MTPESAIKKNAFSPLRTGCALVMLSNMLIYLAVILFVFNLLDPSQLSEDYLEERGTIRDRNEARAHPGESAGQRPRHPHSPRRLHLPHFPTHLEHLSWGPRKSAPHPSSTPPTAARTPGHIHPKKATSRSFSTHIYPRFQPVETHLKQPAPAHLPRETFETLTVERPPELPSPALNTRPEPPKTAISRPQIAPPRATNRAGASANPPARAPRPEKTEELKDPLIRVDTFSPLD